MADKVYCIDGTPIEMLTPEERQARFDRQIGPDLHKLTEEEVKKVRKAYMLDD